MKKFIHSLLLLTSLNIVPSSACDKCHVYNNDNFSIVSTSAIYHSDLQELVLSIKVKGKAGATIPDSTGKLDGAGILTYLFPTTLKPEDIGFGKTDGIVALALTSHPDFDYSPLWDENNNGNYADDGSTWQSHWVILVKDERVGGGYAVKEIKKEEAGKIPTTAPAVLLYIDSPGFQVVFKNNTIKVIIPSYRINHQVKFNFDAATCYMAINTSNIYVPMLGVVNMYEIASGNMSLPYSVKLK